ncbi:MAG: disulfide bond formation protein B [Marinibacterium sp.]|nr:disulfide bond formation protein B [Marinibacterium sp.]
MSRTFLIFLAAAGSAALWLGALGFQHIGGLPPCAMCIWQRYPHAAAIALAVLAMALPGRVVPVLGALAAATTAAIGIFHTGVERGWWDGPSTCSAGDISGLSSEDLLAQIMEAPLVRCDEVAWSFMGLSMASWNAVLSLVLVGLWIAAARARD